ncbi:13628_t:CDS:1, partial [Cetraspora pellucida]
INSRSSSKAIEKCVLQISKIQQLVNDALGKYCEKIYQYESVYQKKLPNNTIEPGTKVIIVPDHNTNSQT